MSDEQYNREWRKQYEATDAVNWEDPDENDGEWPYPTQYKQHAELSNGHRMGQQTGDGSGWESCKPSAPDGDDRG